MIEHRYQTGELGTDKNKVVGYASVFNSPATIPDIHGREFTEVVRPGAFSRHLKAGKDVVALVNHSENHLLGRTGSGTLRLLEDTRGLYFELDLPNTATAEEVRALIDRKDISGCSFAFQVPPNGQRWERKGKVPTRELMDLDLFDVSIVTRPAYPSTSCDLRSVNFGPFRLNNLKLRQYRLMLEDYV